MKRSVNQKRKSVKTLSRQQFRSMLIKEAALNERKMLIESRKRINLFLESAHYEMKSRGYKNRRQINEAAFLKLLTELSFGDLFSKAAPLLGRAFSGDTTKEAIADWIITAVFGESPSGSMGQFLKLFSKQFVGQIGMDDITALMSGKGSACELIGEKLADALFETFAEDYFLDILFGEDKESGFLMGTVKDMGKEAISNYLGDTALVAGLKKKIVEFICKKLESIDLSSLTSSLGKIMGGLGDKGSSMLKGASKLLPGSSAS